jgi:hypothetical protein
VKAWFHKTILVMTHELAMYIAVPSFTLDNH